MFTNRRYFFSLIAWIILLLVRIRYAYTDEIYSSRNQYIFLVQQDKWQDADRLDKFKRNARELPGDPEMLNMEEGEFMKFGLVWLSFWVQEHQAEFLYEENLDIVSILLMPSTSTGRRHQSYGVHHNHNDVYMPTSLQIINYRSPEYRLQVSAPGLAHTLLPHTKNRYQNASKNLFHRTQKKVPWATVRTRGNHQPQPVLRTPRLLNAMPLGSMSQAPTWTITVL